MEPPEMVSVGCQTEPNLIDKLIDNNHVKKQLDDVDLYQEYVRSAQCAQFWPLDKNPIRSLVPNMVKVDLPEQYLKNESLMFDLVQAITNNSKLVNLLAKYIHHIVPNVIISKRIDLIPLITCTIRVCRDTNEQERLLSLLFNLIKRPNEEQRRMILSGIIVVLQVSPNQSSSLLLPNLWDHVNDKFPERRILLAESCATLAHYVRPVMRTNLILSILIQLLKDKNAAVRSAACKSFACLLTLIMDRNDEVFDACLSATEDIIQDVLQQTPVNFCEYRYELEQMRFCALETVYPLLCMWAVKLNRFKLELAEFYLAKAEKYFTNLMNTNNSQQATINHHHHQQQQHQSAANQTTNSSSSTSPTDLHGMSKAAAAAAVARRRSVFFESRNSGSSSNSAGSASSSSGGGGFFSLRRQSAFVGASSPQKVDTSANNGAMLTSQRAIAAYLKMLNYLVPFVFSDAVHSCAWLSKSNLNLPDQKQQQQQASDSTKTEDLCQKQQTSESQEVKKSQDDISQVREDPLQPQEDNLGHNNNVEQVNENESLKEDNSTGTHKKAFAEHECDIKSFPVHHLFDRPLKFGNKLLEPTLIIDESAIVAFHDQLEHEHMIESLEWIFNTFLPKFLSMLSHLSNKKFYPSIGGPSTEIVQEFLISSIASTRQLCLLFGRHLTRTKIRPLIKNYIINNNSPTLFSVYIASLTSFEPIEQQEFEEIVISIRQNLVIADLSRQDVEILAISIRIIATNTEQIHSPSTRQKFLTYILDALVSYSNQSIRTHTTGSSSSYNNPNSSSHNNTNQASSINNNNSNNNNVQSKGGKLVAAVTLKATKSNSGGGGSGNSKTTDQQQTQTKEFILIIFRHILTCLIDQAVRPPDWAHILVTKFLPLLISLANDSTDVYVCTYARLMCAQLVETFDNYLNGPKMTKQTAAAILPALTSLKGLTEQIKASNLKRQIECLTQDLNERFFKDENNNNNNNGIVVVAPNTASNLQ